MVGTKSCIEAEPVCEEEDFIVLPSHLVIAEYLNRVNSSEREHMKIDLITLCDKLSENNILSPMDFEPYGDTLYSEIFDREVMFLSSAGIIRETTGSIKYEITDKGKKLIENRDINYKNISPKVLKVLDGIVAELEIDKD